LHGIRSVITERPLDTFEYLLSSFLTGENRLNSCKKIQRKEIEVGSHLHNDMSYWIAWPLQRSRML